jgi:hypothetical protein
MTAPPPLVPCGFCETRNPQCPECWGTGTTIVFDIADHIPALPGDRLGSFYPERTEFLLPHDSLGCYPRHWLDGCGHPSAVAVRRRPCTSQIPGATGGGMGGLAETLAALGRNVARLLTEGGAAADVSTAKWTLLNARLALGGTETYGQCMATARGPRPSIPEWAATGCDPYTVSLSVVTYTDCPEARAYSLRGDL